jgi:uncharacterized protein YbaP (TraB family)
MTSEELAIIQQFISTELSLEWDAFDGYKPIKLYQAMLPAFIEGELASYEMHFLKEAVQADKPIDGLEGMDEQLSLFDAVPIEEQLSWILEAIQQPEDQEELWARMIDAYKKEDMDGLHNLIIEGSPELAQYTDIFLYDRNARWAKSLVERSAERSLFIAVGAGHLGGDRGLLALLREAGFSLFPE